MVIFGFMWSYEFVCVVYICLLFVFIEYFIVYGSFNLGNVECFVDFVVEIVYVFLIENIENLIIEFGGYGVLYDGKFVVC